MRSPTPLIAASLTLVLAVAVHATDHYLQQRGVGALTTEVRAGGAVIAVAALLVALLAWRGHPRAPQAAVAVGLYVAVGVTAAHFAPHWSAFSDPYPDLDLGLISWAAAAFEVVAAAALAAVGLAAVRRRRPLRQAAPG